MFFFLFIFKTNELLLVNLCSAFQKNTLVISKRQSPNSKLLKFAKLHKVKTSFSITSSSLKKIHDPDFNGAYQP